MDYFHPVQQKEARSLLCIFNGLHHKRDSTIQINWQNEFD